MLAFVQSLYLTDILHAVAQGLLAPVIIGLLLFVAYSVFLIGSVIAEAVTERRNFKVVISKFLAALVAAGEDALADTVIDSGLLRRQKVALLTLWSYRSLPPETLETLAKRLLAVQELRFDRIVGRAEAAVRLAPMLGLMGTLIPLGPGIVALGQGDTQVLASSIGVAFDTTVAGLITAAVAYVVARIRRNWYENYMGALEAAMATLLEKIAGMRERGHVDVVGDATDVNAIVAAAEAEMRDKGISLKELVGAAGEEAKGAPGPKPESSLSSSETAKMPGIPAANGKER